MPLLSDGTIIERTATTGGSWLSSEDPRLHFGLGQNETVDVVDIRYPDGTVERYENVSADQILRLAG